MKDLFGVEIPDAPPKRKRDLAHPARPGTGPDGETCGTCTHCVRTPRGNRHYYKCAWLHKHWTHGPGTDIRLKHEACRFWSRKDQE